MLIAFYSVDIDEQIITVELCCLIPRQPTVSIAICIRLKRSAMINHFSSNGLSNETISAASSLGLAIVDQSNMNQMHQLLIMSSTTNSTT